jgi:hypothetical protein|tara:strand:+ start:1017 stop:1493 length:477 start_codon:yes stop_codon:yes gene_type:complete
MGTFNNKIEAEYNPPRQWILSRALSYQNDKIDIGALKDIGVNVPGNKITCKKGFKTDLASTPKFLWNVIAPWDIARAAIIHDLLYLRIRQYRKKVNKSLGSENPETVSKAKETADNVFLMAMKDSDPKVSNWKIKAAYYAVHLFGRWSIVPREDDPDV